MTKRQLCHSLRSTLRSVEYIIDVPNIAFVRKINRVGYACDDVLMIMLPGHVDRRTGQQ